MDEELERLVVSVRADTAAFAGDVAAMRAELDGPLTKGADRAGRSIETALLRAVRTGKFGFEDLKKAALGVLSEIAAGAVRGAGGGGGSGGLIGIGAGLIGSLLGLPGRATGGPVTGGRPYLVGERGPEVFVPAGSGRVERIGGARGPVSVTVNVAAPREAGPAMMVRTGQQVARQVRRALEQAGE